MNTYKSNIIFDNILSGVILRCKKEDNDPFLITVSGNNVIIKQGAVHTLNGKYFPGNNYVGNMFCRDYMEDILIERHNYEFSLVPNVEYERIIVNIDAKINKEVNVNVKKMYETIRDNVIQSKDVNVKLIQKALKAGIKNDPKSYLALFSSLTGYHTSIENKTEPSFRMDVLFNNPNAAKIIKSSLGIVFVPKVIKGRILPKRMIRN
jgi:hypothetical protein